MSVPDPSDPVDRRRFLERAIRSIVGGISAALAVIVGGSILSPMLGRRRESWLPAGLLADLEDNTPLPVTLRITRNDGYYEAVDRPVIFLVKTGDQVKALSSTCTHLGCRVSYDEHEQLIKCPCHGGVYTPNGDVKSGPPPRSLPSLATRIEGEQVFVQL